MVRHSAKKRCVWVWHDLYWNECCIGGGGHAPLIKIAAGEALHLQRAHGLASSCRRRVFDLKRHTCLPRTAPAAAAAARRVGGISKAGICSHTTPDHILKCFKYILDGFLLCSDQLRFQCLAKFPSSSGTWSTDLCRVLACPLHTTKASREKLELGERASTPDPTKPRHGHANAHSKRRMVFGVYG